MLAGYMSIIFSVNQKNFILAAWMICLAAIFDALDGKVARITNSSSKFGVEYDSLADVVRYHLHFINQTNIYSSVNILKEFGHFSGFGRGNRNNIIDDGAVNSYTVIQEIWGMPSADLGYALRIKFGVTRVFTLWGINQAYIHRQRS